jgi:hypothetical protein
VDRVGPVERFVDPDRLIALENKAIDAGMLQRVANKVMTAKGFTACSTCTDQSGTIRTPV